MHQLLLLRHAKSALDDAVAPDRDRALTPRGRRDALFLRQAMRDFGLAPDVVLVSTARRTLETLAALEPWDDTPLIEPMDTLYLASGAGLLAALRDVAETVRAVLLIGHNPGLHQLASDLTDRRASAAPLVEAVESGFPTATLAEFAFAGPWFRLDHGGARLLRIVAPKRGKERD